MNARTRTFLAIGLPVLLVVVVVGILLFRSAGGSGGASVSSTPGTKAPLKMTPMKLALDFTPNPNHTGIYVALAKGWYRQQGIDLTILPFSQNTFPDTLVATNKADVGISGTESVALDDVPGQPPIVSLATIAAHNMSYVVVRNDSPITSPKDLDGKTYGGYGAPYEVPIMQNVIKHAGGKGIFKNVTLGTDAISALRAKQIDFAWVFNLDIVGAERSGLHLRKFAVTDYGVPDYYSPTIITSQTEIQQKPGLLHRFMTATAQGYEFARTHADEAAQILISQAPKGTFPDTGLVVASQESLSPLYGDPGQQWGIQRASAWQGYTEFILPTDSVKDQSGKVVTSLDPSKMYTNQFLP